MLCSLEGLLGVANRTKEAEELSGLWTFRDQRAPLKLVLDMNLAEQELQKVSTEANYGPVQTRYHLTEVNIKSSFRVSQVSSRRTGWGRPELRI